MQTIVAKSNYDLVGLIVIPENGEYLNSNELEELLHYVKYVVELYGDLENNDNILNSIEITDFGFQIPNIGVDVINKIIKTCHDYITERIIVPQDMGKLPAIRHRPLYFSKGKTQNSINVKYTVLGDFNDLKAAFKHLGNCYSMVQNCGKKIQDITISN